MNHQLCEAQVKTGVFSSQRCFSLLPKVVWYTNNRFDQIIVSKFSNTYNTKAFSLVIPMGSEAKKSSFAVIKCLHNQRISDAKADSQHWWAKLYKRILSALQSDGINCMNDGRVQVVQESLFSHRYYNFKLWSDTKQNWIFCLNQPNNQFLWPGLY